jgi:hypothetical protein
MDRFFIGQRVRILCHLALPALGGRPARIVGHITRIRRSDQAFGIDTHWLVAPEDPDGGPPARSSLAYVIGKAQLEPLPPEGMRPVEWIDCAWQPEQVPAVVEVPRSVSAQQRVLKALARRFGR